MRIYLFIAAIAGGVTYLITPLIRHIAIEIGAVGEVRARDVHTIPTPRLGGLGMLIGFTVASTVVAADPYGRDGIAILREGVIHEPVIRKALTLNGGALGV